MAVNSFREDEHMEQSSKMRTVLRLFSYMKYYVGKVIAVLLCMAVTVAIALINPLIIEHAIDVNIANKDFGGLLKLAGFALILNVIYIIMVKIRMYVMAHISNSILMKIRQELYIHIQKLSFTFFDSRPTGKILARIIGDVNSLKEVLTNAVTTLIPDFIMVVGVVAIMMVKNWKLALASLCSIPVMIVAMFAVQIVSHKRWGIFRKKSSNLNAYIHEDIAGIRVVQSFHAQQETKEVFDGLAEEHQKSFAKITFLQIQLICT